MPLTSKLLNLEWNQHAKYWVGLEPANTMPADLLSLLQEQGWKRRQLSHEYWVCEVAYPWLPAWLKVQHIAEKYASELKVAVIGGQVEPDAVEFGLHWKSLDAINAVAQSIWLAEALQRGDVLCYLQPVLSSAEEVVGYESFARVRDEQGKIISGLEIVNAARALGIEYAIDRHLHIEAIKTYVLGKAEGYLFINFFPGFIQRPEVYLEGLSETARAYGIIAKHIVLDFTQSELPRDIIHLRKVTEYCRAKGYAIALDDMESVSMMQKLVPEIKPDFIKLDKALVKRAVDAAEADNIKQMVAQTHATRGLVIAEGVETEESFKYLKTLGVDMFQGYYFSPPVPVEEALKLKR